MALLRRSITRRLTLTCIRHLNVDFLPSTHRDLPRYLVVVDGRHTERCQQYLCAVKVRLKLTFTQYPAIHTNYIISHCTTLQYNHNYMTRYLDRNEILDTKNNEINSAAIFPVWHELPMLHRGQINVAGIRRRHVLENSCLKRSHYCCIDM